MSDNTYSIVAKTFLCSGRLPGLTEGFTFYQTPTGEKINSRTLLENLIVIALNELIKNNLISMDQSEKKPLIGAALPILLFTKNPGQTTGFLSTILSKINQQTELIKIIQDLLGGKYEIPEYPLLFMIASEFNPAEFKQDIEVKRFLLPKRIEKHWRPDVVTPLVAKWLPEILPIWQEAASVPWRQTAIRNIRFGLSFSTHFDDRDHDD